MLHDVIPLETPEYVEPSAVKGHATMVDQTARLAAGLIVTSQAAKGQSSMPCNAVERPPSRPWRCPCPCKPHSGGPPNLIQPSRACPISWFAARSSTARTS